MERDAIKMDFFVVSERCIILHILEAYLAHFVRLWMHVGLWRERETNKTFLEVQPRATLAY